MTTPIRQAGLVAAVFVLGLVAGLVLRSQPVPLAGGGANATAWQLPALPDGAAGADAARALRASSVWPGADQSDSNRADPDAAEQSEAERRAAEQAEAERAANTWRFVGSIEQGDDLRAVFRAGDGRARRLGAGEEIEHGARLVELQPDSAVIELPRRLRAQNDLPETEGPVRLQLFRDTEFSLYIEEE